MGLKAGNEPKRFFGMPLSFYLKSSSKIRPNSSSAWTLFHSKIWAREFFWPLLVKKEAISG
jgi:hypothetical protein